MADDSTESSNEGFTRITPLAINLTANSSPESATKPKTSLKHSPLIWLGLGVLLSSSLVVVFLLPNWVSVPEVKPAAQTSSATPAPQAARQISNKDAVSPWEKAQESRLRKETQDILSQMLEAQKVLSKKGVELWAGEDYALAMQYAATGDEKYNLRDFANSRVEYEKALAIFSRLVEEMDVVFETTMEKGKQALAEGNAAAAMEAFQLALAIDAIDRAANIGRTRAESLDEVMALIEKGDKLLDLEQFEEARQSYQQALALDGYFDAAKQKIAEADRRILDREFNKYMSAGFAAMEKQQFIQARKSFNEARRLKPRSAEARAALEQTRHKLTTININALLAAARTLETQEKWHEAMAKYSAALELDSSLAEAQQGRQRTELRGKIHDRLEQILARPKRLYDPKVYAETVAFQNKLSALANPGPVLSRQLASLRKYLDKALTPVDVTLQSDNLTLVTLRKFGELGFFVKKNLSLRPGKYVAVGIRRGYRDVRVEFTVDPEQNRQIVTVQAAEKIALGS